MIKDNQRITARERGLIKGSLRRTFSRSELRQAALAKTSIKGYSDPKRPRVTKWSMCPECKTPSPSYLMQVDHQSPIVPLDSSLEEMTWDQLVNNLWCVLENLNAICTQCHKVKSKGEAKIRAANKRAKNPPKPKASKKSKKAKS